MGQSHLKSLDGLRGWAAAAVIFYHGLLHYDLGSIERVLYRSLFFIDGATDYGLKALLVIFNGESAVIIFFILSGFVLRLSLERMSKAEPWRLMGVFFVNRAFRLFPALIVSLVAFKIFGDASQSVGLPFPSVSWSAVVQNAALAKILVIGPSWSIQTELAATVIIVSGFFVRRWFGFPGLLVFALYMCLAIDFPLFVARSANLWPYGLAFVLGMIVAERDCVQAFGRMNPVVQLVFLVGFVGGRHLVERAGISGLITQTVFGALLLGSLASHSGTKLARVLEAPFSQFLGRISYSLYLVNVIWLYLMWAVLPVPSPTEPLMVMLTGFVSALAAFVLAIPCSYLSYWFVEVPGINIGKRAASIFWINQDRAPSIGGVSTVTPLRPAELDGTSGVSPTAS